MYFRCVEDRTPIDTDGGTSDGEARNAYEEALAALDTCFAPEEDDVCSRLLFKRRTQSPDEFTLYFIQDIQRLVKLYKFRAATDVMMQDQILC